MKKDLLLENENIDLIMDEPKNPIDKAKFIISNVYYYIRTFYNGIFVDSLSNDFQDYLNSFKKKFTKINIHYKFSFDLLNKSYVDESQKCDSNTNNDLTNEAYYDLLYKRLVNILIEQKYDKEEKNLIDSFISLRNCLIFLEYLYLFLIHYPDKLSHYIIKIDISFLLDIPQKSSKRLINSDEFFYLNLIELKGIFPEIKFTPSSFVTQIENLLYNKYLIEVREIKIHKLNFLKSQLYNLLMNLSKINNKHYNNKIALLYDYINEKYKKLSEDLVIRKINVNYDELIENYIFENQKCENKFLQDILDEINEEKNLIPSFNYLFLIALNNYNELNLKKSDNNISQDSNEKNESKGNNINNDKQIIDKGIVNLDKAEEIPINKKDNNENQNKINKEKEMIMKIEELRVEIKNVEDKDISELKYEEILEEKNKYFNFTNRKFLYNKALNFDEKNIYNILFFLEINKQTSEKRIRNIDDIYIEYKNNFISLVKNLNCVNYNYFYNLISEKYFYDEIIAILKSKPISDYLNGYRYYDEINKKDSNQNKYKFTFVDKGEFYIENFSEEYDELMKYLEDSIFFTNLFRLKFLPFGVKAFVNYNLKIFINSLFYEFSENITKGNKTIIFKAALKIIIIHEIMHILKYLKNNANFNSIPKTPRDREGGKMLINYLFGKPVIKRINLDEAKKINDLNYWKDVEELRKIFQKDNDLEEKDELNVKTIDHIDLYFTEEDVDDEDIKLDESNEDIGIDID